MLSSTTYKGLCPFLYPPVLRQHALVHRRACLRVQGDRSLSTSPKRLKPGEAAASPTATPRTAGPPPSTVAPPPAPSSSSSSSSANPLDAIPAIPSQLGTFTPNPPPPNPNDPVPPEYEGEQHRKERATEMPLRFLDKPLGLPSPPTTKKRGWEELKVDLLDRQKRLGEREHLVKQILTGYYDDVQQLKKHGGKRWIAPEVLIKQDLAMYLPNVTGTPLSKNETVHTTDLCKGKISAVGFIGSQQAERHIEAFTRLTLETYGDDPNFRFIQINLQENPLKSFLVSLFASRIRKQIPEKLHPYYLLSSHNMEYYREPLGYTNKFIGYLYLLDEDLKIRWAGGGWPNPEEQISLHKCTGVLLKRLREKPAKKGTTQHGKGARK